MKAGDIYKTKINGDLKIIKYTNASCVEVEFLLTGYRALTTKVVIIRGYIKDYLRPSVCGVGFIGVGKYVASVGRVMTKAYKTWHCMISRCYNENMQKTNPTYKDCSVCKEWYDFQVFAEWFFNNYIEGYELDKDIRVDGNRIYGPEYCKFVSQAENSIKANAKKYKFISPSGDLVEVYNLSKFSKRNKLILAGMSLLASGLRKSHKGWKNYA